MMMKLGIAVEIVATSEEGATVKAKTVSGETLLVVDPRSVFPALSTPVDEKQSDKGKLHQFWVGSWFEHRKVCLECDNGNRPLCGRAQEIAKHIGPEGWTTG
jgi:hypothetical protein